MSGILYGLIAPVCGDLHFVRAPEIRDVLWHKARQRRFSAIVVTILSSPFGWPKT
jgi:hypothetical protein